MLYAATASFLGVDLLQLNFTYCHETESIHIFRPNAMISTGNGSLEPPDGLGY